MSKTTRLLSLLLVLCLSAPVAYAGDDEEVVDDLLELAKKGDKNAIELYYSSLVRAEPDEEEALEIGARTIDLPYGKVTLDGGLLIPVEPKELADKDNPKGIDVPEREFISAIYLGEGRFEYEPPTETERWSVNFNLADLHPAKKYTDLDKIDVAIDGGMVIYFEGKWRDLFLEGTETTAIDKKTAEKAKKLWKARGDLWQGPMARLDTLDQLTGVERDGLTLDVQQKDLKGVPALSYFIDPLDTDHEEVQLAVVRRYALNKDATNWWLLASWFHPDHAEGKDMRELGYSRLELPFDVHHYNMDMTVYRDGDAGYWGMKVKGTLDMSFIEPTNTLMFAMMSYGENEWDPNKSYDEVKLSGSNRVNVTDITDGDGNPLEFMHNGHVLTIKLPRIYEQDEKLSIKFRYQGLFIMTMKQPPPQTSLTDSRNVDVDIINFRVPNDYPWFPQNQSHKDSYTFEWTLRLPKPMIAATSGTLLGMEEVGKYNVHHIKETTPVTFPAMLFGRFGVKENNPDYDAGEYKIRLYTHPGFDKDAQSFLDEAQGVIAFYEAMFGPYPFDELDIAQMPLGIGYAQAPAGLVQMDGATYISKTDLVNLWNADDTMLDIRDNFVPHEIAHEWWGHKAGWGSSRDQWVSETFAEYAAALYIEYREARKSGDPEDLKGYEDRKRRWGIDGRLGHTYDRTGPVWVGNRTRNRRTSTIYARGPLILDMIRENFGKEAVIKVMYTWCELAGKNDGKVVTEDLQYVLEQALPGVGFEEFMDMYIKGNEPLPDDPKINKADKLGKAKY